MDFSKEFEPFLLDLRVASRYVNNLSTFLSSDLRADDYMLLYKDNSLESAVVNEIITKVKGAFVLSHHLGVPIVR